MLIQKFLILAATFLALKKSQENSGKFKVTQGKYFDLKEWQP